LRLIKFLIKRTVFLVFTLLGVSVITFVITNILPGSAATAMLGISATPERVEMLEEQLQLNEPLWVRYLDWLVSFATGDMGRSLQTEIKVEVMIMNRIPRTFFLGISAFTLAVIFSIPLGIYAAVNRSTWKDLAASAFSLVGISLPSFFWGIVAILIFAQGLDLLPPSGYNNPLEDTVGAIKHVVLPASALAFGLLAHMTRMTRSSVVEELQSEYVKLAESKGLAQMKILFEHVLRNAFLPVLTVLGFYIGWLFGGVVVIEQLFAYPGLGSLTYSALVNRDIPVIQGTVMVFATIFMMSNLVVDLLYGVLDPRVEG